MFITVFRTWHFPYTQRLEVCISHLPPFGTMITFFSFVFVSRQCTLQTSLPRKPQTFVVVFFMSENNCIVETELNDMIHIYYFRMTWKKHTFVLYRTNIASSKKS